MKHDNIINGERVSYYLIIAIDWNENLIYFDRFGTCCVRLHHYRRAIEHFSCAWSCMMDVCRFVVWLLSPLWWCNVINDVTELSLKVLVLTTCIISNFINDLTKYVVLAIRLVPRCIVLSFVYNPWTMNDYGLVVAELYFSLWYPCCDTSDNAFILSLSVLLNIFQNGDHMRLCWP